MIKLQHFYFESFLGKLTIVEKNDILVYIGLPHSKLAAIQNWCERKFGNINLELINNCESKTFKQLNDYFSGSSKIFSVDYEIYQTEFRKKALKAVEKIPFGHTKSYGDIAKSIGNPKAVRAVGSANAKNPLPIIIPCHRVIAQNGGLGGYGGGLDMKIKLLEFEGWNG